MDMDTVEMLVALSQVAPIETFEEEGTEVFLNAAALDVIKGGLIFRN